MRKSMASMGGDPVETIESKFGTLYRVPEFNGRFAVDLEGNVYGLNGEPSRIKPRTRGGSSAYNNGRNYLSVGYREKGTGKRKDVYVHQLIARAFHGPYPKPRNKHEIHHKNADKHDNSKDNLEYRKRKHNRILPHTGEEVPL